MKHLMIIAAMLCGTAYAHPAWDALGITNRADVVRRRAEIREWCKAHPAEMAAWREAHPPRKATPTDAVSRALAMHEQFVANYTNTHMMVEGKWKPKREQRKRRIVTPAKKVDPKLEKFRRLKRKGR